MDCGTYINNGSYWQLKESLCPCVGAKCEGMCASGILHKQRALVYHVCPHNARRPEVIEGSPLKANCKLMDDLQEIANLAKQ